MPLNLRGRARFGGYYGRYSGRSAEHKFFDQAVDDAVVASTGDVFDSVNTIVQGVTESRRIGRKCVLTKLLWHYRILLPKTDSTASPKDQEIVRVMVFLDKQCNGATAVVLDILETADILSFRNLSNTNRFDILMDRTHVINYGTLAMDFDANLYSTCPEIRSYSWFKKCHIPLEFSSTTGVITEIRSNNVGVLIISEDGSAGLFSIFRIRFSDQG